MRAENAGRKNTNTKNTKSIYQPSRRTGVSPVYVNVGVRFIEPVSGRINPTPTKNIKIYTEFLSLYNFVFFEF